MSEQVRPKEQKQQATIYKLQAMLRCSLLKIFRFLHDALRTGYRKEAYFIRKQLCSAELSVLCFSAA